MIKHSFVIIFILIALVGLPHIAISSDEIRFPAFYSNMDATPSGEHIVGTQMFFTYGNNDLFVLLRCSESEPSDPFLVRLKKSKSPNAYQFVVKDFSVICDGDYQVEFTKNGVYISFKSTPLPHVHYEKQLLPRVRL